MQQFGPENIRNIALLSHAGAGKTSAAEAMLFTAKAINRLGKVDDGSSTSDYDADEIKRKISINLSLLPCPWRDAKVNIIDTPGFVVGVFCGSGTSEASGEERPIAGEARPWNPSTNGLSPCSS